MVPSLFARGGERPLVAAKCSGSSPSGACAKPCVGSASARLRALPMHHRGDGGARRRAWGCLFTVFSCSPADATGLKSQARASVRARAVAARTDELPQPELACKPASLLRQPNASSRNYFVRARVHWILVPL